VRVSRRRSAALSPAARLARLGDRPGSETGALDADRRGTSLPRTPGARRTSREARRRGSEERRSSRSSVRSSRTQEGFLRRQLAGSGEVRSATTSATRRPSSHDLEGWRGFSRARPRGGGPEAASSTARLQVTRDVPFRVGRRRLARAAASACAPTLRSHSSGCVNVAKKSMLSSGVGRSRGFQFSTRTRRPIRKHPLCARRRKRQPGRARREERRNGRSLPDGVGKVRLRQESVGAHGCRRRDRDEQTHEDARKRQHRTLIGHPPFQSSARRGGMIMCIGRRPAEP